LETTKVKLLLSMAALMGSLGMLLSDWSGQAFPYL
jgi:ABC-type Fe3+-siderophore transport system permease subunit